jgi:Domain of unknown function (DUF1772)
MTLTQMLFGVALFCSAILAGGVVTVSLVMIPALRTFTVPVEEFAVHQKFNPLPDYYMPQSLFISTFAGIGLLAAGHGLTEAARSLIWVAIALALPGILISLALNRRINLMIRRWSADGVPAGYAQLREDWDISHILRTVLCFVIAVCYVVAAGLVLR